MSTFDFSQFRSLVVEDNDFVRFMVKKYLTEYGFRHVDEASNGQEGIQMLGRRPDIVICDIGMQPMNGFEFLKHVRAQSDGMARMPIIFLTSSADMDSVMKAVDLQVDAYLLKPVMPNVLKSKIVTLMTRLMTA